MKPEEILDTCLKSCFEEYKIPISEKYRGYLIIALNNFGKQCFEASREQKKFYPFWPKRFDAEFVNKYDSFEEYLKSLEHE